MNQPAKAAEPTMEEILASIRRIIADDDAGKSVKSKPEAAATREDIEAMLQHEVGDEDESAPPAADVLELTESMQAHAPFQAVEGPPDVAFSDPEGLPEPARPEPAGPEPSRPDPPRPDAMPLQTTRAELPAYDRALLSPRASAAVDMAFNTLAHTVLVQNSRTLEDLVREMLKPMLKAWLDDNLPNMVERLVRAEIERVSRGRG
jgi:uncharacterized protein